MALSPGTRLGAYEVISLLGAGGMGEVYRARDTRLKRDVAIKVLPDVFANDPERLARFQREAELLATLNHPNIAQIHGLEDHALVLELVEGPTLADRIAHGPIPIDEALTIARQIAEALDAAHHHGVIHRDLKPANIKVRDDGTVKVLDFGLAKAMERNATPNENLSSALSQSPTITSPVMTGLAGVILGTAAYMSPEQAKGKAADKRSDVWAFGCVMYEMLTGARAFEGDDISDTLAAVLRAEPDWTRLPPNLPEQTRLLLRKCLEKDRAKRISDIGIARFLLTETIAPIATSHTGAAGAKLPLWRRVTPAATSAVLAALVGGVVVSQWGRDELPRITRFTYQLGSDQAFTNTGRPVVALSDDGTQMAFVANFGLYVRNLSELHAKLLVSAGSAAQGTGSITTPAFSSDGRSIAFWAAGTATAGTIKKVSTAGGTPLTICQATNPYGMSWHGDDILFGQLGRGIMKVSASSGQPEVVVPKKENELGSPQLLPGGRHILYTMAGGADWTASSIVLHELGTNNAKTIIRNGAEGRYVPSGHIVYAQEGVLMAAAFDPARMEVRGEAIPVVEGVRRATAAAGIPTAHFTISDDGSLAYLPGPTKLNSELFDVALLDHKDAITPLNLPSNMYSFPRFSPDGRYLAVGVESATSADIWIYDASGTSALRRLTFGGNNRLPAWSGDSKRVAFQSDREGDFAIFWQLADGTGVAERLTTPEKGTAHWPYDLSPSSDTMLFGVQQNPSYSIWTLSLKDKKAEPLGNIKSNGALSATFSPDGKWVAYSSNLTAGSLVFVQPFPPTGAVHQVGPGINPFWSGDGRYLYYSPGPAGFFNQVAVQTKPAFNVSNPVIVPRTRAFLRLGYPANYDIAPNNQRFAIVVNRAPATTSGPTIEIVLNWFEELKQRVPLRD